MLLLASVLALATSHAAPQSLRGSDTSSKTLIFVTEDHVSAHAKTMDLTLKSDWRAMLAAAPQYVAPREDLSPLLLRSLHSAAAPHTAKWALALRSTTPSTFTTAQYHSGAWMLSDLLLAAGATSITCETSPSSTLVQLTLLRSGLPLPSMADLYSARNALFDDHAALTSSLHRVPSHQGELDKFLARALGDGTGLSSSPLIVDEASAPVIANTGCRSGQVFVVASAALSNDQLTATLRPATSPMDIYNSIDSVFGLSDDPDCVSSPYFNGLAANQLNAKISLVPQIQFNLTVGITDPVTAEALMPFTFAPTIYLDMQTGKPGSAPPSGVSAHCPEKFDTWYALFFGSDLVLGFGGLSLTALETTYPISGPAATALPLATPAPLPGDGTSGCVSKTWVPPNPPAPPSPPGSNSGGGGGVSGALIGGIIGGVIALAIAGGAAYYFLVLQRSKGGDSGDSRYQGLVAMN